MKRSAFEVFFRHEDGTRTSFVELAMFAGGLSSTVGEAIPGDDKEANAGMVLNILGYQLRPYVFFNSMGELMSLFWSGAGQEKTPALQGTLLLQKGQHVHYLSNGVRVKFSNHGAVSFDLSGQAKVSMWSKTSESMVENSLAYALTQGTSLSLLNLPAFTQDTTFNTKVYNQNFPIFFDKID